MSAHTPAHHEHDPPPKATLFCPTCGHESAPTGDWTVREADQREASDRASGDEGTAGREADQREASDRASGESEARSASNASGRSPRADAASRETGGAVVECPVCGTDVATRGRSEATSGRRGPEAPADD